MGIKFAPNRTEVWARGLIASMHIWGVRNPVDIATKCVPVADAVLDAYIKKTKEILKTAKDADELGD